MVNLKHSIFAGLVALALAASPAVATDGLIYSTPVPQPPARFVHAPDIAYSVAYLPANEVANLKCPGRERYMRGCTVRGKQMNGAYIAWVYIRNDLCPKKAPDSCALSAKVLAHEIGHVNGWPSNHPH